MVSTMDQPIPKYSYEDLERVLGRDFPGKVEEA
jgi:hypothetical protein